MSAIEHTIRNDCWRQVGKRLSLKLAQALLDNPSAADIIYAQRLVHVLKERIDRKVEIVTQYL